jgi:hypothetical protein
MLQTAPLAQIYLVSIEIDFTSDVNKFRHLGPKFCLFLFFLLAVIRQCLYFANGLSYRFQFVVGHSDQISYFKYAEFDL